MKFSIFTLIAVTPLLLGCGGNSLNNPLLSATPVETDTGTDPAVPTSATSAVVIPKDLKGNLADATVVPASGGQPATLRVQIEALDTTPIDATWQRRPALDTAGYVAFAVQEDALDRLFIGLARSSADGSANAVVAGDGGQFNIFFAGTKYARTGAYTPPVATGPGNGNGQVSYAGKYVGLLNGGGARTETLTIPRATTPVEQPAQATRITGDVFMNANFADNAINGVVKNRTAVDLAITNDTASPVYNDGSGVALEDVVMIKSDILVNGTFTGVAQRPGNIDPEKSTIGSYGGVIGGISGSSVAGAVDLTTVFHNDDDALSGALEKGVFVLDQCGLPTSPAHSDCVGTAP